MSRLAQAWNLPLLVKELAEQSTRKRTYVIRTVYALLLFGFATLIFWANVYQEINSPFDVLGRGREMFMTVLALQFAGVYLFMPAITCGVLTSEKERNTIGLLLLTKLGPTTILLEKLLGRLVPMGTFLLLSLPLMGFSYALGGVTQHELWIGIWALFITVLQVGAVALACSAFFRTTVQAFIATYVIGVLIYFGPVMLGEMSYTVSEFYRVLADTYNGIWNALATSVFSFGPLAGLSEFVGAPPAGNPLSLQQYDFPGLLLAPIMLVDQWNISLWQVVPRSLPVIVTIAGFLGLARLFVVRRAFVPSRNLLLKVFHRLDDLFQRINQNRVTKGIVLINESSTLPEGEPVAWRETRKKSLGTLRYLIRIFVATEVPVLIICLLMATSTSASGMEAVSAVLFLLWIMAALLVCVKGATLVAGERSHETLDVLLSTPLRSRELVRQKFRGVRRLMIVLAMPLLTIVFFQTYMRLGFTNYNSGEDDSSLLYFLAAGLAVVVYLPLVAWVSFAIGLRLKSQARAIFASLAVIVGWCAIPLIVGMSILELFRMHQTSVFHYFMLLSPATIIPMAEFTVLDEINHTPWFAVLLNYSFYIPILLLVRWYSLAFAARHLGRAESLVPIATRPLRVRTDWSEWTAPREAAAVQTAARPEA